MLDGRHTEDPARPRRNARLRREQQQFVAVLVLFVVVSLIIGALYLVQATTTVTTARDIQQMREDRDRLLRDIELLRAESAELNSVPNLMERAAALGFVTARPEDIQYIVIDGYVYDQPAPTLTPVLVTPTPQVYDDNFAGWLTRQFDALRALFTAWSQE
ncbi:MAG: hypothetical protein ACLFTK_14220 [Anaerolineales bacterium]